MRIVLISIFCFLLPIAKAGAQINLCDTVVVLRYEPIPVAVAPGHFINGYEIQGADVNYHVTINKQKKIEFVSTADTAFTIGTITVGTPYFSIPKSMIASERPDYGWGYEVTFKNGWTAVFADGLVIKSLKATRKSKIGWFYKTTDCKEYSTILE